MIKNFKPVDFVVLIFLLLSGVLISYDHTKTEYFPMLISARLAAVLIIFLLVKLHTNYKNRIISFLRHFYPLIFTAYFYGETGYYNNIFFPDLDGIFVQLENSIFGFQPALWFSSKFNSIWFNELMNFSYFSFYLLVIIFTTLLYFKKKHEFDKSFFIIIFSLYSYYLFFAIFPVVGPQFYFPPDPGEINNPLFFGTIIKFIQDIGETPTGAFPSSHVGISWIIFMISAKAYKRPPKIIFLLSLFICFSTVYIKAHYVVDVIGGIFSAPILYFLGNKIYAYYQLKFLDINSLTKLYMYDHINKRSKK